MQNCLQIIVSFFLLDRVSGDGMCWLWDRKYRTDFAIEFGQYNVARLEYHHHNDNIYVRWFPLHSTLHKRIHITGHKGCHEFIYEIWDPNRKQMWRGQAETVYSGLEKGKVPSESEGGVWYYLNNHTTGDLENHCKFFHAKMQK